MKDMMKDAIILFVITLIAGLGLGYVYNITKTPIEISKQESKNASYREVFVDAASFESSQDVPKYDELEGYLEAGYQGISIDEVLDALDSAGNKLGYVMLVTTKNGYGGDITFSIGITNEGVINKLSILSISETAGLGMRAEEVLVPQFEGDEIQDYTVTKTGSTSESQIDAISGATITSNAVTNAVDASIYYFKIALGGGLDEE